MTRRMGLALLAASVAVSGCASTRGGQDIACPAFGQFAIAPRPSAFVADIQRYAIEDRGSNPASGVGLETLGGPAQPASVSVGDLVEEAAFPDGMDLDALRREGERLQREYEAKRAASGGVGLESLGAAGAGESAGENEIIVTSSLPRGNALLLSGGGQWGAFGAGLFVGLACTQTEGLNADRNVMPCVTITRDEAGQEIARTLNAGALDFARIDAMDIGLITGVSTGGLQSLLLMVVLDKTQPKDTRVQALQRLITEYAPPSQSAVVDYDGYGAVLFQGSVAGTDALRGTVNRVLREEYTFLVEDDEGDLSPSRHRLVDQIALSPIKTVVGVVEGADGQFKAVNMKEMVTELQADTGPANEAVDCVMATTLASSAMPVFHQQLRVQRELEPGEEPIETPLKDVTLFDGGVRRSVFISDFGKVYRRPFATIAREMTRPAYDALLGSDSLAKIYVLRNGPTTATLQENVNAVDSAVNQAFRAYSLLVNELEVNSIAALRLANPFGPIDVTTADGSEDEELSPKALPGTARIGCEKIEEMFSPTFMRCLQNFGARRGMGLELDGQSRPQPIPAFWPLSIIDPPTKDDPETAEAGEPPS
ncbi:MAG: hypothetical protein AAF650_02490 [Pseudomonadota bacterium]